MAWDKDKPAEGIKAKFLNDLVRENNAALEDALGRDHAFPGTMGDDAGEHLQITFNAPLGADPSGVANKGILYTKDVTALAELFFVREDDVVCRVEMFPTGTVMLFGQNAAPTGWTRKADWTDNSMLVYTSSGDIEAGGTVSAKSWHRHTVPSHTHTISHVHATPDHALTIAQLPVHRFPILCGKFLDDGSSIVIDVRGAGNAGDTTKYTEYLGSGQGHNHGNTGNSSVASSGSSGTVATGLNDQPYFQEVIAATKD